MEGTGRGCPERGAAAKERFEENMREMRYGRGLTLEELARMTGSNRWRLSEVELGKAKTLDLALAASIAEALGSDVGAMTRA